MLWILNLTTVSLLGIFSLLFLGSMVKVPAVIKIIGTLKGHIDNLAVAGVIFGIVAACCMPLLAALPKYMFTYLVSNLVLVIMALPYMLHKFEKQLENKTNAAILGEIRTSLGWITRNEHILGMIGGGAAAAILVASAGIF